MELQSRKIQAVSATDTYPGRPDAPQPIPIYPSPVSPPTHPDLEPPLPDPYPAPIPQPLI